MDNNNKVYMYGLDGGRRLIPINQKDELLKKGWKIMNDSSQEYRPELDRTLKSYREEGAEEVEVKDEDFLEYKVC